MKKLYLILAFQIGLSQVVLCQTNLSAGDLAITSVSSSGDDNFSFVLFKSVTSGTVIFFTDKGYNSGTGALVSNTSSEGTITWTANAALTAGTEVTIGTPKTSPNPSSGTATETHAFNLSGGGDQIIAYQGSIDSPVRYLYVLNTRVFLSGPTNEIINTFNLSTVTGAGEGASEILNTNVPTGLTDGVNAFTLTAHKDNIQFKCLAGGTTLEQYMIEGNYNTANSPTTYVSTGLASGCSGGASPEINVKQSATNIASGGSHGFGTVQIGDSKDIVFTVENTGSGDLDITSISTSGTGFSISSTISSDPVSASGSASFTVRFQPTATSQTSGSVTIVSDDADEGTYTINFTATTTNATLSIKVFLEGPLVGSSMNTILNSVLPGVQPYSSATAESSTGIPATVVDWVEVELRTGTASGTKVGTNRAALLKSDGTIVDKDGNTFTMSRVDGSSYHIVIHHRNHLSVMSASPVAASAGVYTYDFTTALSQSFNNGASQVGSVFAMPAGDADGDGDVDATDLTTWRGQNGATFSYNSTNGDFNLDGEINAVDRNDFQQKNTSKTSQVPGT